MVDGVLKTNELKTIKQQLQFCWGSRGDGMG
jgi:hypothetical protein